MRLIVVTRPRAQAGPWVAALQAQGQPAAALPLIDIAPVDDLRPLHAAWDAIGGCALVVFVSANAVAHFHAAAPGGSRWPVGVVAGSTGPGTTAALRLAGVPAESIVEPAADTSYDSESLWQRLADRDWQGRRVCVVRGEDGRDWLATALRERGAEVDYIAAYRRCPPRLDTDAAALLKAALHAPASHLWLFSSSEAVGHLVDLAPDADWSTSAALATHARIAEAARGAGFGLVNVVAPTVAAVAARAVKD